MVLAASFEDGTGQQAMKDQLEVIGDMYKLVTGALPPDQVKGERSSEAKQRRGSEG